MQKQSIEHHIPVIVCLSQLKDIWIGDMWVEIGEGG